MEMRWKECAIVDDNKFDRLICKKILERIDGDLTTCEFQTGKEILDHILSNPGSGDPMLILLDLNMPEMNGYEFMEEVKQNEKLREKMSNMRIAIITSSARPEDRERSMSFPLVVGYLQKPILTGMLRNLLESTSDLLENQSV